MEVFETASIDAETDAFSLIDVSASDDDFLLASSSEPNVADNADQIFTEGAPMNQPSNSLVLHKPGKTKKCNLRKSLAWDSAFFTNAGVLDPEELSSIMEGSETGLKQSPFLPGIQEELSKSTDSVSTFQSDNVTLESLEADLFCDIRASIQRCSKSADKGNSCESKILGEEPKSDCSTKIPESSCKMVAKAKAASNRPNLAARGPMRILKPGSACKQEIKPPVNRSKESTSMLSRPLKPGGPSLQIPANTKRMSVSASRVKPDSKAAGNVNGKGASLPDASNQVKTRKPLPKAPASSKISAASSALNRTTTYSSRSSCDSSSSSTSENIRKSQMGVIRKKMVKNVNMLPSPKNRTSTNTVEKVKSQNKESHLSDYLKSTSKPSSSTSPASSISEWSTESCSSTATVNQKHAGLNPYPLTSHDVGADRNDSQNLHNPSSDRALGDQGNQVPVSCQSAKQPSIGSAVSNSRSGSAKPSGLRMPSPNIGFFDGAKAGAKTPSSSSRSRSALPSSLPRSAAGTPKTSGTTSKTRFGNSASKTTEVAVTGAATAKPKEQIIDASLNTTAARTPFTIKNIVSNVVEVSTESLTKGDILKGDTLKGDALNSPEISQKRNS